MSTKRRRNAQRRHKNEAQRELAAEVGAEASAESQLAVDPEAATGADWTPEMAQEALPAESAGLDFADEEFADDELVRDRAAQTRPSDDPLYDAARVYVAAAEASRARKAAGLGDTRRQRAQLDNSIGELARLIARRQS